MSKLGIILTGQMRTYDSERIMHSYQRFLSTYVPIDLFIFTWKNRGYSNNHGQPDLNNHQDDIISENDIISYYSQFKFITIKKIVIEDFDSFINSLPPNMKKLYHTPFRFHSITTTSIPIEYKYQQAIKYLESIDHSKYSNIMFTRPDMEILCDLPVQSPVNDIVYYNHCCYRCMDHCWFGSTNTLIKQLSTIYDDYEKNQNAITSSNDMNRDNNEILIYQCSKNEIELKVKDGSFVRLIHFKDL
jgi:hypothetical protein